jgi:putative tricarboxylic transport membrane protein
MRINDAILGVIIIAFSILVMVDAHSYPALPGVPYGPGLFPTIIAGCMLLGGLILIFKGLRHFRESGWFSWDNWAKRPRTYVTLCLIFLALLFYIFFSERLGFLLTSVMILFPLLLWTRGRERFVSSLIISISFSFIIYLAFAKLVRVPLPPGLMEGIL